MKLCKIDGCDNPQSARGWCPKHWARWKRHGDPLGGRQTQSIQPHQRFGRLVVIEQEEQRYQGAIRWRCRCDCGKETTVVAQTLREGRTRSCGCGVGNAAKQHHTKHGYARDEVNYTNGNKRHYLYNTWLNMRARCNNPKNPGYPDYGGRGITIDPRWDDFGQFVADMGDRPTRLHSLDRLDNDGPYSPENCHWATRAQQMANRRDIGNGSLKKLPDYLDDCLEFLERYRDDLSYDQQERLQTLAFVRKLQQQISFV